ncbi:MAG: transcriptional regulator, TetR family [Solirubrobacterales bacterium]|nr:transcriptional regulator, TetR family [Solirubrobacterales bacterium]
MAEPGDEAAPGVLRLPPGRHGLSRDFVSESQRERLLNGVVEAVVAHGYNATTVTQLIEAASVSRRTFYEHFSGKEDCFLAAYEMIVTHLHRSLREAEAQASWPDRVRAELAALLRIFAADPTVARFALLESLAAGGALAARHRASLRCFAELLRPDPPAASDALAEAREQALVGGVSTLVVRRLEAGEAASLEDLLPDLHELVLTSYLGRGEAQRLARPSAA